MGATWLGRRGRSAVVAALLLLPVGHPPPTGAQTTTSDRIVIAPNVVCRAEPGLEAPAVASLRLGDLLHAPEMRERSDGAWFLVRHRPCWVFGALTTGFDREDPGSALLVIADRVLDKERPSFEELVEVENLFQDRGTRGFAEAEAASPLLQLRRLRIIDRAGFALFRLEASRNPLAMAWILSKGELLRYFEPGGVWFVPRSHFWELYDTHAHAPAAEEIAWTAAELPILTDECYAHCVLRKVTDTYMQYWVRFPAGAHIEEALARAVAQAEHASRFCGLIAMDPPYLNERDAVREALGPLRESLDAVTAEAREPLLARLAEIESACVDAVFDEGDEDSLIPAFARALGLGFSIVPQTLAGLGEGAASAILAAAASPSGDAREVQDALHVAGCLVRDHEARPLSPETFDAIRGIAAARLTGLQHGPVLSGAIDLAAVLGDPELMRIVEALATNPDEIEARVGEIWIPQVQRRAAHALDGTVRLRAC